MLASKFQPLLRVTLYRKRRAAVLIPLPSRTCAEPYRPASQKTPGSLEERKSFVILRTEVRILQPLPARCRRLSRLHPIWLVNRWPQVQPRNRSVP